MTHEELIQALVLMESGDLNQERLALIHDLEVHQTELEMQNQQLREAQGMLEESRARYADLYDFAPVAYCTFDKSGCVSEINLTGAALLGEERARLVGKPFARFVTKKNRPKFLAHLDQCFSKGEMVNTEITLSCAREATIVVQLGSTLSLDAHRQVHGCRTTLTDVSERQQSVDALRVSVRMREDFLAIVSHDLRNPLNAIHLSTELLLKGGPATERRHSGSKHYLTIQRAVARMNRLISDLLDLSSMDAGHLSMDRRTQDLADLACVVDEMLRPSAAEKKVRLEVHIETQPLYAFCDRERVSQVLVNLLGNAIKFTPPNGLVSLTIKAQAGDVVVEVRDTGIGIEPSQRAHIFDPYWQAEKSAKKGTGLGLSIAKGIVDYHGGRIWVESDGLSGTAFFFTLPSRSPHDLSAIANLQPVRARHNALPGRRPGRTRATNPAVPKTKTVMIVDDENDTRDSLVDLLSDQGFDTITAANGAEAIDYLRTATTKPFLILLDLVMPVMDGWQFLEKRREDSELNKIPVVLISGQANARETAATLGLAGCLEKPIGIASLFQMIDSLV